MSNLTRQFLVDRYRSLPEPERRRQMERAEALARLESYEAEVVNEADRLIEYLDLLPTVQLLHIQATCSGLPKYIRPLKAALLRLKRASRRLDTIEDTQAQNV